MMNHKVELFIFRHGETDWNAQRKFQGHTDIPLNAKGKSQAEELFQKFSTLQPQVCLSSDLVRAVETAKIGLRDHEISYVYSPALRETFLGDVEGLSQVEITEKYGEEVLTRWRSIEEKDLTMSFPNGESKLDHLIRVQNFIRNFIQLNNHFNKLAISSHGGAVVRLVHSCINAPKEPIGIPNCCLYHLEFDKNENQFSFIKQI